MSETKPTTGRYSIKRYQCKRCGHESQEGTNHWGEIYSRCSNCSWKYPLEATVKVCLEPVPEGYGTPEPWKIVKLGDVAEIKPGAFLAASKAYFKEKS